MYAGEVERRRAEVRRLYERRRQITEVMKACVGLLEDRAAREMFFEALMESLPLPYRVANAIEAEVDARLQEARSAGKVPRELEAEAEQTRREAREVRERATARLTGDDVLGPLLDKLQEIY